jgi:hypothetical protein
MLSEHPQVIMSPVHTFSVMHLTNFCYTYLELYISQTQGRDSGISLMANTRKIVLTMYKVSHNHNKEQV